VEGIGQEVGPVLATEIEVEKVHQHNAAPAVPGKPRVRLQDDDD
jgi:hypothetical protein